MSSLDHALDLFRRLPPSQLPDNLQTLFAISPELEDEISCSVDQPLLIRHDNTPEGKGREYLCCQFNMDAGSWRSPWSSTYDPPLGAGSAAAAAGGDGAQDADLEDEEGAQPSPQLRELEIKANEAFATYKQMYYEGGLSSVYLWNPEETDDSIAGVVLIRKDVDDGPGPKSTWSSMHVFEANMEKGSKYAEYKLTSTIMLSLARKSDDKLGNLELSGSLTRLDAARLEVPTLASHIGNVGRLIENQEAKIRGLLQEVYFGKTRDIVGSLRSVESLAESRRQQDLQRELMGMMRKKAAAAV
ncbi:F-actin-capping protein subunit beta [Tilletia horrida]|uniref:F-actin-capping protein subunit beta n=1 Tax=Tilletia horrida TaxID=155126 RepID=A0AAN6JQK7_9BASI|nr:F-actin-capping protein subunit beta [Tilletia horrida]KAK0531289.1 F-actin-capping protein subunit beta [Tilletia horrida]KAK0535893.1 F-actin-capping protein subunit beta [Tilletia horrida]KAK0564455.1 F-actin-capping protein subunit beta [Tilletia horrida]